MSCHIKHLKQCLANSKHAINNLLSLLSLLFYQGIEVYLLNKIICIYFSWALV